ncbi:MAG: nicotinamidase [Planctomycetes bacterium]|nr:nicotinamidase [Planctomycetota bacterium]
MTPAYYSPEQASKLYMERAGEVAEAALAWRRRHDIKPAATDDMRIALLGIDVQNCFAMPGGSLFVPGAVEDTQSALNWLYTNLPRVTGLYFSLDTHSVYQVFHPAWWADADGNHPAPLTPISAADVEGGRWRALREPEASLEYVRKLEQGGRYTLTIWPYHALLGGVGHALVPAVMEAAVFHSIVRDAQTHIVTKGREPRSENYSILSPEVTELGNRQVGAFNESLFRELMTYDRVYVWGQAKSHCVLSTLLDLRDRIMELDGGMLKKIWILEDAMSPVPAPPIDPLPESLNFPAIADRTVTELARAGMNVTRTTEPLAA